MKSTSVLLVFILISTLLSSCSVVEGIFKAGVWVGILAVVGIIALVIFLISRFSKKG